MPSKLPTISLSDESTTNTTPMLNDFHNSIVPNKILNANSSISSILELDINCDSISASATSSSSIESVLQTSHSFPYNSIFDNIKSNKEKTDKLNNYKCDFTTIATLNTTKPILTDEISSSSENINELYNSLSYTQHKDLNDFTKHKFLKNISNTLKTTENELDHNILNSNQNLKNFLALPEVSTSPSLSLLLQQQQQQQQQTDLKREQLALLLSFLYSTQTVLPLQNLSSPTLTNSNEMRSHLINPDVSMLQKVKKIFFLIK